MNKIKKISLSNYSLVTQIIIINLITAIIGCIFLLLINYFLLSNNNNLDKQIRYIKDDLNQITNFLSNNAIKKIPQFNLKNCEETFDSLDNDCFEKNFSNPQLDPTLTQRYLLENYLYGMYKIKIYDNSWIKFADTEDIYISDDVVEIDAKQDLFNLDIFISGKELLTKVNDEGSKNLFNRYKKNYVNIFNYFQKNFNNIALSKIEKFKSNILLVKETIKNNNNIFYTHKDENLNTILVISQPIINNNNTYGVVIASGILTNLNNETALISFNLFNLFIIIIFITFFFSILFSRSIVVPIKILSKIVRIERDKSHKNNKNIVYPIRKDEIGILSQDIRSMSKDLKKRIEEIENFAADVSHELKNPIASLKNSNELLFNNKIAEEKKFLLIRNMQKDIERMNSLITDISNYTLTQVEIEDELFYDFDLTLFLKDFLESYQSNAKNVKINFHYEKDKSSIIYANQHKLAQVFINLIENSLSYSPPNSEILINHSVINQEVIIQVIDQGSGISLNLRDKIFDRFYTDRPLEQNKHSGLGLSITKKIIESFSGSIKLINNKSQKYLGACFQINLPLKDK